MFEAARIDHFQLAPSNPQSQPRGHPQQSRGRKYLENDTKWFIIFGYGPYTGLKYLELMQIYHTLQVVF